MTKVELAPSPRSISDDSLQQQFLNEVLQASYTVPPMPQVAAQVLDLTRDADFSLRDLGNVILTDQAIAARVLRYANSPYRNFGRPVESLVQAVQRLGVQEVVNITLALSLHGETPRLAVFAAARQRLWLHSAVAAFCARTLARGANLDAHTGFLCGLLMDFGQAVLYSLFEKAHRQQPAFSHRLLTQLEEIVREYHPQVGGVVGQQWNLPTQVVAAMAFHHSGGEPPFSNPYVAVANLADYLAELVLSVPRAALEESLLQVTPEQLIAQPSAQALGWQIEEAQACITELPGLVDQGLDFINN